MKNDDRLCVIIIAMYRLNLLNPFFFLRTACLMDISTQTFFL